MALFGSFEEKGYQFASFYPNDPDADPAYKKDVPYFRVTISAGGKLLHTIYFPMMYDPIFAVDNNDVARLEEISDKVLAILPEPEKFNAATIAKIDAVVADTI